MGTVHTDLAVQDGVPDGDRRGRRPVRAQTPE